ncbi:MAG: 16S rRNA (cytosine(1402)-N(4))-methyltransferase RsmH [Patescibacteria group bacterium]|nr:16S rRNA (cytosine(1402)-N(4))-methyltransferase RsmH [Patescibacteria group bacterium]
MTLHKPVLLKEVLKYLDPKAGGTIIDCTAGGGGHLRAIRERVGGKGTVVALDIDEKNIQILRQEIEKQKARNVILIKNNFKNLKRALESVGIKRVDGILADLGFSSDQLETVPGLSFRRDDRLDMRFERTSKITAQDILNKCSEQRLVEIFRDYGEEARAGCIARRIVKARRERRITKVSELGEIIRQCWGNRDRVSGLDVCTKTFMALRIAVNDELNNFSKMLEQSLDLLGPGARLAVISFHSLEDRIVKRFFRRESGKCVCPEDEPRCVCNHKPSLKILTKKPVMADIEEIKINRRARSAKLRAAEKI